MHPPPFLPPPQKNTREKKSDDFSFHTFLKIIFMIFSGIPQEEGRKKIWLKDSRGLVVEGRAKGGITEHKAPFAHPHAPMEELNEIVKELKPSVLIGAAAIGKIFDLYSSLPF